MNRTNRRSTMRLEYTKMVGCSSFKKVSQSKNDKKGDKHKSKESWHYVLIHQPTNNIADLTFWIFIPGYTPTVLPVRWAWSSRSRRRSFAFRSPTRCFRQSWRWRRWIGGRRRRWGIRRWWWRIRRIRTRWWRTWRGWRWSTRTASCFLFVRSTNSVNEWSNFG